VSVCSEDTRDIWAKYSWGFPLYRLVFFGISTLPPGTFRDSHFTARWTEKRRFPTLQPSSETKLSVQAWQNSILCVKGGKWAISVAGDVCGMSISPKTKISFPHEPHILCFFTFLRSLFAQSRLRLFRLESMQQPDYSTKTIFHERNDLVLFILSVMRGGYNIKIRCNQKFMFCKDRDIDFRINNIYYIEIK